jgi:uncharacterized membrane protein YfcA
MPNLDAFLASPWLVWVIIVMVVGGLAHGTMGFGFPLISTPMIALVTDIQTAVLVSLFPNLAVNVVSTLRGGRWRASLARYWPVAVYVLIGTVAGTRLLLIADPEPLKLLLALMIVVYLQQSRFAGAGWSWLSRHPRKSAALFGSLAGVLSGAVNVAVPPLVIYFMALGLDALAMTQILNLCFLVGRLAQAATFGLSGHLGLSTFMATIPLTAVSLAALFVGMQLQRRIRAEVFRALLRRVLWVMAAVLAAQALGRIAGL